MRSLALLTFNLNTSWSVGLYGFYIPGPSLDVMAFMQSPFNFYLEWHSDSSDELYERV